jgi:hypothetical protein
VYCLDCGLTCSTVRHPAALYTRFLPLLQSARKHIPTRDPVCPNTFSSMCAADIRTYQERMATYEGNKLYHDPMVVRYPPSPQPLRSVIPRALSILGCAHTDCDCDSTGREGPPAGTGTGIVLKPPSGCMFEKLITEVSYLKFFFGGGFVVASRPTNKQARGVGEELMVFFGDRREDGGDALGC